MFEMALVGVEVPNLSPRCCKHMVCLQDFCTTQFPLNLCPHWIPPSKSNLIFSQRQNFFTKYWESRTVNSVECEMRNAQVNLKMEPLVVISCYGWSTTNSFKVSKLRNRTPIVTWISEWGHTRQVWTRWIKVCLSPNNSIQIQVWIYGSAGTNGLSDLGGSCCVVFIKVRIS